MVTFVNQELFGLTKDVKSSDTIIITGGYTQDEIDKHTSVSINLASLKTDSVELFIHEVNNGRNHSFIDMNILSLSENSYGQHLSAADRIVISREVQDNVNYQRGDIYFMAIPYKGIFIDAKILNENFKIINSAILHRKENPVVMHEANNDKYLSYNNVLYLVGFIDFKNALIDNKKPLITSRLKIWNSKKIGVINVQHLNVYPDKIERSNWVQTSSLIDTTNKKINSIFPITK